MQRSQATLPTLRGDNKLGRLQTPVAGLVKCVPSQKPKQPVKHDHKSACALWTSVGPPVYLSELNACVCLVPVLCTPFRNLPNTCARLQAVREFKFIHSLSNLSLSNSNSSANILIEKSSLESSKKVHSIKAKFHPKRKAIRTAISLRIAKID